MRRLLLLLASVPTLAWAQSDAGTAFQTVVTALRLPRAQSDSTSTVTVLSRPEIERATALNADDFLRTVPNVQTFRRSSSLVADPTSQGLSLRDVGPSSVSRALVLLDGVPMNDAFGGWVYWQALSLLDVERVEIAPTGASALYGNFGLGGVAQFVSRPLERAIEAEVSGGSFSTFDGRARAANTWGPVGATVFGEFLQTAGYDVVSPAERGSIDVPAASSHAVVGARVRYAPDEHLSLTLHGRYFEEAEEGGTAWTRSRVEMGWYGASLQYEAHRAGLFTAQGFGSEERFEQDRGRVSAARGVEAHSGMQSVPSHSQGASVGWTAPAGSVGRGNVVTAGVDFLRVRGVSKEALFPASRLPGDRLERSGGGEQGFAGVFAEDVVHAGDAWELSGAARVDLWRNRDGLRSTTTRAGEVTATKVDDRGGAQLDPKLGVRYRATPWMTWRATGYRAFRAPTLNELYRPFQVGTVLTDPNAALTPETLWGGEVGPTFVVAGAVLRVTGFWNELRNPITNVTLPSALPDGAVRQRQNLGGARIRGGELEFSWRIAAAWSATGGLVVSDPRVSASPRAPELVGKLVPQAPTERATAALTYADPRIVTATAQLRFNGPQYEDDQNLLLLRGYVLVDLRVSRELGEGFRLFGVIENLLDRRYVVGRAGVTTVGQPLNARLGLEYRR